VFSLLQGPSNALGAALVEDPWIKAVERFLRLVCYQDLPAGLLPPAVGDENPLKLPRYIS